MGLYRIGMLALGLLFAGCHGAANYTVYKGNYWGRYYHANIKPVESNGCVSAITTEGKTITFCGDYIVDDFTNCSCDICLKRKSLLFAEK